MNKYNQFMVLRHLRHKMRVSLRDTPVLFLNGARQVGKSTVAQQLVGPEWPARYLTLDDATVLGATLADPQAVVSVLDGPVILDEVQRAPELFLAIKAAVDRNRMPGRFLLTGSSNAMLLPKVADSLAGRMEIVTLWPFSQGELDGVEERFIDILFGNATPQLRGEGLGIWDRVARGGFPEVCARENQERREAWFRSYITSILERDVRDLANIEGLAQLPRLLGLLATRLGGLLNYADVGRGMAIPQTTLKRYLTLLETVFLVHLVPPWSNNAETRFVKSPKLYLVDTGLACALLAAGAADLQPGGRWRGPLLENFVMLEIQKQLSNGPGGTRLYHFRLQTGREVDFVLATPKGEVAGVEVKAASSVGKDDFKGLQTLKEVAGERFRKGVVLYTGTEAVPFAPDLWAMPVEALWQ